MQQIFIGTYTENTQSQGIYTVLFEEATGKLSLSSVCTQCKNASFIVQQGAYLFAAEELEECGQVASFRISADGQLTRISEQSVPGSLTCHVQLNAAGTHLYAANYGSGCYFGCPVSNGTLGPAHTHIHDHGQGAHPTRQEGPHAHSVCFAPLENELFTADLGIDRIRRDRIRPDGTLAPHPVQPYLPLPAEEGPRHFALHPGGQWLYVVTELGNRIFRFTRKDPVWSRTGTWSTLPPAFSGENYAADLHISPDGTRLFASNRGADDVAVYRIAAEDGALKELFRVSAHGKTPRSFALLANGRYLMIANQNSDDLAVYKLENNATQAALVSELSLPAPVCVCPRR